MDETQKRPEGSEIGVVPAQEKEREFSYDEIVLMVQDEVREVRRKSDQMAKEDSTVSGEAQEIANQAQELEESFIRRLQAIFQNPGYAFEKRRYDKRQREFEKWDSKKLRAEFDRKIKSIERQIKSLVRQNRTVGRGIVDQEDSYRAAFQDHDVLSRLEDLSFDLSKVPNSESYYGSVSHELSVLLNRAISAQSELGNIDQALRLWENFPNKDREDHRSVPRSIAEAVMKEAFEKVELPEEKRVGSVDDLHYRREAIATVQKHMRSRLSGHDRILQRAYRLFTQVEDSFLAGKEALLFSRSDDFAEAFFKSSEASQEYVKNNYNEPSRKLEYNTDLETYWLDILADDQADSIISFLKESMHPHIILYKHKNDRDIVVHFMHSFSDDVRKETYDIARSFRAHYNLRGGDLLGIAQLLGRGIDEEQVKGLSIQTIRVLYNTGTFLDKEKLDQVVDRESLDELNTTLLDSYYKHKELRDEFLQTKIPPSAVRYWKKVQDRVLEGSDEVTLSRYVEKAESYIESVNALVMKLGPKLAEAFFHHIEPSGEGQRIVAQNLEGDPKEIVEAYLKIVTAFPQMKMRMDQIDNLDLHLERTDSIINGVRWFQKEISDFDFPVSRDWLDVYDLAADQRLNRGRELVKRLLNAGDQYIYAVPPGLTHTEVPHGHYKKQKREASQIKRLFVMEKYIKDDLLLEKTLLPTVDENVVPALDALGYETGRGSDRFKDSLNKFLNNDVTLGEMNTPDALILEQHLRETADTITRMKRDGWFDEFGKLTSKQLSELARFSELVPHANAARDIYDIVESNEMGKMNDFVRQTGINYLDFKSLSIAYKRPDCGPLFYLLKSDKDKAVFGIPEGIIQSLIALKDAGVPLAMFPQTPDESSKFDFRFWTWKGKEQYLAQLCIKAHDIAPQISFDELVILGISDTTEGEVENIAREYALVGREGQPTWTQDLRYVAGKFGKEPEDLEQEDFDILRERIADIEKAIGKELSSLMKMTISRSSSEVVSFLKKNPDIVHTLEDMGKGFRSGFRDEIIDIDPLFLVDPRFWEAPTLTKSKFENTAAAILVIDIAKAFEKVGVGFGIDYTADAFNPIPQVYEEAQWLFSKERLRALSTKGKVGSRGLAVCAELLDQEQFDRLIPIFLNTDNGVYTEVVIKKIQTFSDEQVSVFEQIADELGAPIKGDIIHAILDEIVIGGPASEVIARLDAFSAEPSEESADGTTSDRSADVVKKSWKNARDTGAVLKFKEKSPPFVDYYQSKAGGSLKYVVTREEFDEILTYIDNLDEQSLSRFNSIVEIYPTALYMIGSKRSYEKELNQTEVSLLGRLPDIIGHEKADLLIDLLSIIKGKYTGSFLTDFSGNSLAFIEQRLTPQVVEDLKGMPEWFFSGPLTIELLVAYASELDLKKMLQVGERVRDITGVVNSNVLALFDADTDLDRIAQLQEMSSYPVSKDTLPLLAEACEGEMKDIALKLLACLPNPRPLVMDTVFDMLKIMSEEFRALYMKENAHLFGWNFVLERGKLIEDLGFSPNDADQLLLQKQEKAPNDWDRSVDLHTVKLILDNKKYGKQHIHFFNQVIKHFEGDNDALLDIFLQEKEVLSKKMENEWKRIPDWMKQKESFFVFAAEVVPATIVTNLKEIPDHIKSDFEFTKLVALHASALGRFTANRQLHETGMLNKELLDHAYSQLEQYDTQDDDSDEKTEMVGYAKILMVNRILADEDADVIVRQHLTPLPTAALSDGISAFLQKRSHELLARSRSKKDIDKAIDVLVGELKSPSVETLTFFLPLVQPSNLLNYVSLEYSGDVRSLIEALSKEQNFSTLFGAWSLIPETWFTSHEFWVEAAKHKPYKVIENIDKLKENKDVSFAEIARHLGSLPIREIVKIEDSEIAQHIPWYKALQRLRKIQDYSSRAEHCPWENELQPLVSHLHKEEILDFESEQDGQLLVDYVDKFGAYNLQNIAVLFIKGQRTENLAELFKDDPELQKDIAEFVGEERLPRFKKSSELVNEMHRLRRRIQADVLKDKIPRRLKTKVGEEIFSALRGQTRWERGSNLQDLIQVWENTIAQKDEEGEKHVDVLPKGYREETIPLLSEVKEVEEIDPEEIEAQMNAILTQESLNERWTEIAKRIEVGLKIQNVGESWKRMQESALTLFDQAKGSLSEKLEKTLHPRGKETLQNQLIEVTSVIEQFELIVCDDNEVASDEGLVSFMGEIAQFMSDIKKNKALKPLYSALSTYLFELSVMHMHSVAPGNFKETLAGFTHSSDESMNADEIIKYGGLITDYVKEHYLHPSQEGRTDRETGEIIAGGPDHTGHSPFSQELYNVLSTAWDVKGDVHKGNELVRAGNRLQRLKDASMQSAESEQSITFVPSRGLLRIFSGDIADACYTSQHAQLAKGEFDDLTAIIMVTNRGTAQERIEGSVLFIETKTKKKKESVLHVRANNPRENLLGKVDSDALNRAILEYARRTAKRRDMSRADVPLDRASASCSNRKDVAKYYNDKFKFNPRLALENTPETNFNGYTNWNARSGSRVVEFWNAKEDRIYTRKEDDVPKKELNERRLKQDQRMVVVS